MNLALGKPPLLRLRDWLRQSRRIHWWPILALLAVLWMETTAISLWYEAVFEPAAITWARIFAILLGIFIVTHLLAHGLEALHGRILYRRLALGAWVILIMFVSLKLLIFAHRAISPGALVLLPLRFILSGEVGEGSFFHLIIIGLLIWRSVSLTRSPVTLMSAQASFQLGLVALLLYGMIFSYTHPIQATAGLYEFLFCGLIAMSAARLANLSELRGGRIARFSAGWVASIVLAGLALVGLAILIGALISGRVLDVIAVILLVFFSILTALTLFVLSPLLALLAELIPLLSDFLQTLLERLKSLNFSEQLQRLANQLNNGIAKVMPVIMVGRGAMLVSILVVLVVAILLALRLRKMQREAIEEEETATAASENVPNLLQKLLSRLLKDARGLRLRNPAQLLAAARIRQIYRQLMALSSKLGAERPASITPLEFLPRVQKLFPEEESGLQDITSAYLKVRYGEYPETREEVSQVETAWARIRRQGRKLRSARMRKG